MTQQTSNQFKMSPLALMSDKYKILQKSIFKCFEKIQRNVIKQLDNMGHLQQRVREAIFVKNKTRDKPPF